MENHIFVESWINKQGLSIVVPPQKESRGCWRGSRPFPRQPNKGRRNFQGPASPPSSSCMQLIKMAKYFSTCFDWFIGRMIEWLVSFEWWSQSLVLRKVPPPKCKCKNGPTINTGFMQPKQQSRANEIKCLPIIRGFIKLCKPSQQQKLQAQIKRAIVQDKKSQTKKDKRKLS